MANNMKSGKGGAKGTGQSRGIGGAATRRYKAVRVKSAASRSNSSTRWLARQLNDPYVHAAKAEGFRSRAAYKLLQMDEKFHLLRSGMRVVDLGAAPGGWSQVVAQKILASGKGQLVALDILAMDNLAGAQVIQADFTVDDAPDKVKALLKGKADLVLSDMAAPTTGHHDTDHLRIMHLAELALVFAREVLAPNGAFVCKLFQGGAQGDLMHQLKESFRTVRYAKPAASRTGSSETYLVAQGFKGRG